MKLKSLPEIVLALWGWPDSAKAVDEYKLAFAGRPMLVRDLAMFCYAAAPNDAATDFERGVIEGKRRVWLHISRMRNLEHTDFVAVADGTLKT
jgi:hypothetical protein